MAVSSRSSRAFLVSESTVSSGLGSSVLRGRFTASVSRASLAPTISCLICFLHSSERPHLISQPGQFSRLCHLRYVLVDRTVVHSTRTRRYEFASSAAQNEVVGIQRITNFVPGLVPEKSLQNSTSRNSSGPSEFQFCIICIVVSERTKLLHPAHCRRVCVCMPFVRHP